MDTLSTQTLFHNCLECKSSACCKDLDIKISKKEYYGLKRKIKKAFILSSDIFFNKNPGKKSRSLRNHLHEIYENDFAVMKKDKDGYCYFLDRESMLCTVYDDRPPVCKNYLSNRCGSIREINHEA